AAGFAPGAGGEEAEVRGRPAGAPGARGRRVGGHRGEGAEEDPAVRPVGWGAPGPPEGPAGPAKDYTTQGEGKGDPDGELLPSIIRKHLKNVESKKYQAIARDLEVSLEEVVAAIKLLARLDPKPGRNYSGEEAQYITPDVYIHKIGDQYVTVLNDDGLSKLR